MTTKKKTSQAPADLLRSKETLLLLIGAVLALILLILRPAADITPKRLLSLQLPDTLKSQQQNATLPPRLPGIDVSHFQGQVDWTLVEQAGVKFVYLKATEGETHRDPNYRQNLKALNDLGLRFGEYHFYIPQDDPKKQAEHFLEQIKGSNSNLPPVLDIEIAGEKNAKELREDIKIWLSHVKQKFCKPMIYSSAYFWRDNLGPGFDSNNDKDYPLWLAEYHDQPRLLEKLGRWNFWQHSQDGVVNGIESHVDLSWFNGDTKALEQFRCES